MALGPAGERERDPGSPPRPWDPDYVPTFSRDTQLQQLIEKHILAVWAFGAIGIAFLIAGISAWFKSDDKK